MFSVIFEVQPAQGKKDEYLELAKHLKPILETIDGFVDNERFESKLNPGWILSHSTWRDEKSVIRWRTQGGHHAAQEKGRSDIFQDYHLRVGDVTSDTHPPKAAPVNERRFDDTEVGAAKVVTFTEITPADSAALSVEFELLPSRLGLDASNGTIAEHNVFASIYTPGKLALLVSWKDLKAAERWSPLGIEGAELRHRKVRVVRDYGRFDRREAPQFYPDVKGGETKHAEPVRKRA
jgi:heme-degrading monooxygenase HmoA